MVAQTPPRSEDNLAPKVRDIYKSIMVEGMGFSEKIVPDID
jgi:hypothetical protein